MSATLRLGLIADPQYAQAPPDTKRYGVIHPAEGLTRLREAIDTFNALGVDAVVNLGDLVQSPDRDTRDAQTAAETFGPVVEALRWCRAPILHAVGNHDLDFGRKAFERHTGVTSYRARHDLQGWRFLILDGNEVSTRHDNPDDPRCVEARAYQEAAPEQNATWNGALGTDQRRWLAEELSSAEREGVPVVVINHWPCHPDAARERHRLYDAAETASLLRGFNCVKACFAGHDHPGASVDDAGLHHLTLRAACFAGPGQNGYAMATLTRDRLLIRGFGLVPDAGYQLR